MRGYLGNQTKTRPNKTGNKSKGNTNRRRRRRPPQDGGYPEDDEGSLEVIPPDQLEASKNVMNLTELKTRPATALVELGESLGLEKLARSRKQDIIFSILKAHAGQGENIYGEVSLRSCKMASASCVLPIVPILPGPTIYTSARVRFVALVYAPETRSPD